jgi:hypothetical protein
MLKPGSCEGAALGGDCKPAEGTDGAFEAGAVTPAAGVCDVTGVAARREVTMEDGDSEATGGA